MGLPGQIPGAAPWVSRPGFSRSSAAIVPTRSAEVRSRSWKEFVKPLPDAENRKQAARCMDCGIPFCHEGCPVNNLIPDWNNLVYRDQWRAALKTLHSTNNFPEFTGRICPAPCEAACTLNIDDNPVTIKTIECAIVDRGWREGWIEPVVPARAPANASRWSVRAPRGSPARSNWRAPGTR